MLAIRQQFRHLPTAILLPILALIGCTSETSTPTDSYVRVPVSGTVTLEGTPVPKGSIQLTPAEGTKGPVTSAEIIEGKFSIEQANGPTAGKYKVSISGRPTATIKSDEMPGGTPKLVPEPVPTKYNTASTLETDVPAGGSSTLEFALKK